MGKILLRDAIRITDKDILNAMAKKLYEMDYKDISLKNALEYNDVIEELKKAIENPKIVEYYFMGELVLKTTNLEIACSKFNNFKSSMYITDIFLVIETFDNHFKLGLLSIIDREEFARVGKLDEILSFLSEIDFPYEWEYKKFFRLGCSFNKVDQKNLN